MQENIFTTKINKEWIAQEKLELLNELEELEQELHLFDNIESEKEMGFVFSKGGGSRPRYTIS